MGDWTAILLTWVTGLPFVDMCDWTALCSHEGLDCLVFTWGLHCLLLAWGSGLPFADVMTAMLLTWATGLPFAAMGYMQTKIY